MLRKSMRKLLALIVAVVIGLMLLRWLEAQTPVASRFDGQALVAFGASESSRLILC